MSSGNNSPFEQEIQNVAPQVRPEAISSLKRSGFEDRFIMDITKNQVKTETLKHYDAKKGTKRDASGEEKKTEH